MKRFKTESQLYFSRDVFFAGNETWNPLIISNAKIKWLNMILSDVKRPWFYIICGLGKVDVRVGVWTQLCSITTMSSTCTSNYYAIIAHVNEGD